MIRLYEFPNHRDFRLGRSRCLMLLAMLGLLLLSACDSADTSGAVVTRVVVEEEDQEVTRIVRETVAVVPTPEADTDREPVELDISFVGELPNVDPQKADTENGIDLVENLFVGLTKYNHETNRIEPELALDWEVSRNGRVWTFRLRDDVYWIRPDGGSRDDSGAADVEPIRRVVAADMVYAIQRACQRETGMPDAFVLFLIQGCEQVYSLVEATPVDLEAIGANALNDSTLQIVLTKPASHFLTITSLWFFRPVPRQQVEELGDEWQTAENLLVSGPFLPVSGSLSDDTRITLHRNPLWPVTPRGNVDIVNVFHVESEREAFEWWQEQRLDIGPLPAEEREDVLNDTPLKVRLVTDQTVFYLAYNFGSGVFREPEIRRAFGAAIDRERLVEAIYDGEALGMRHLTPPDVIAAPPVDEVGKGYSPDDARQALDNSGFGSCRLMPPITLLISSSDRSLRQAELIRDMWVEELDCIEEQIVIEQVQFGTLLANTRKDAGATRPDVWELGWASYYPDANNWFADLLHCTDSENRQNRPCSEVDDMIRQAASTFDPERRLALYRQIENMFFGDGGIAPLTPLYVRGNSILVQSWLEYAPAHFGGEQFDTYFIQADLKQLERSR